MYKLVIVALLAISARGQMCFSDREFEINRFADVMQLERWTALSEEQSSAFGEQSSAFGEQSSVLGEEQSSVLEEEQAVRQGGSLRTKVIALDVHRADGAPRSFLGE